MNNQLDSTKKSFQSKAKNYILAPTQLLCDKNTTYREKTLLLAHYLHNINDSSSVCSKISSLVLRYSNFKTNKPSRRFIDSLRRLQAKGYLTLIDGKYSCINPSKFKYSAKVALDSIVFHSKELNFNSLLAVFWLSLRKESNYNCTNYMAKCLKIDRNTLAKYLRELEAKKIVFANSTEVNGKSTKNFHIHEGFKPVFYARSRHVDKSVCNSVETNVHNSAQLDYYYLKIIINRIVSSSNLKNIARRMFTLTDIIDSKSFEVKRLINAVKTNLYFKNKLVTCDQINEKLRDIGVDLDERGVIKVFKNSHQFINFASGLFNTTSYPLDAALKNELLLRDIQKTVLEKRGEEYGIDFIKWLASKIFPKDFIIYHVNIFKNRMIDALMNEKRNGEETLKWSEEKYIDWEAEHMAEKKRNNAFW